MALDPHIRKVVQQIAALDREGLLDFLRSLPECNPVVDDDYAGLTLSQLRQFVLNEVLNHYHRLWGYW